MIKINLKPALYSGLMLTALFLSACREKRSKHANNYPNDICPAVASIFPEIDTGVVLIPTAFSPNGDGKNDVWRPVFKNVTALEIKIIDAAGNLLFRSNGLTDGWEPLNGSKKGMTKYLAWIRATSTMGNVMEKCTYIYSYYCTPQHAPIDNNLLQFGDQLNPNSPGTFLPTMETFKNCD